MKNKKINVTGGFVYRTHKKQRCAKCTKTVTKVYPDSNTHEYMCSDCIAFLISIRKGLKERDSMDKYMDKYMSRIISK